MNLKPRLNRELQSLVKKKKFNSYPLLLGGYPCNFTMIFNFRNFWRYEFQVRDEILANAKNRLNKHIDIWKSRNHMAKTSIDPVVITVHVRRTDYINHMKERDGDILGKSYFAKAFTYFKKR